MFLRLYSSLSRHRRPVSISAAFFASSAISFKSLDFLKPTMSVKEIVESAIADNKVAIFSKSWCSYSTKAKNIFAAEFPEVTPLILELDKRDDGADIQAYLLQKTGQRTVPNVFVNKQHIGGGDDVAASLKQGKLRGLVEA